MAYWLPYYRHGCSRHRWRRETEWQALEYSSLKRRKTSDLGAHAAAWARFWQCQCDIIYSSDRLAHPWTRSLPMPSPERSDSILSMLLGPIFSPLMNEVQYSTVLAFEAVLCGGRVQRRNCTVWDTSLVRAGASAQIW